MGERETDDEQTETAREEGEREREHTWQKSSRAPPEIKQKKKKIITATSHYDWH